ncbi:MAG TPA: DUF1194 domain-containing protein [Aliidongia sp.]|nr:DUF1194 domain-containing protein [Aliidongia sp.]
MRGLSGLALALLLAGSAVAAPETVDTALVLAVDVSGSVTSARYKLQMEGLARAFEDPGVRAAILNGASHSMLVSLVEWSDRPTLSIPWSLLTRPEDIDAFAKRIRGTQRASGDFTCMARALDFVADKVLPFLPAPTQHKVVDVSGDGRDNCNPERTTDAVRADLVATGVTINGLPILEGDEKDTLADWYRLHVIGGDGAFELPANGFADFERAMEQKFREEISEAGRRATIR